MKGTTMKQELDMLEPTYKIIPALEVIEMCTKHQDDWGWCPQIVKNGLMYFIQIDCSSNKLLFCKKENDNGFMPSSESIEDVFSGFVALFDYNVSSYPVVLEIIDLTS